MTIDWVSPEGQIIAGIIVALVVLIVTFIFRKTVWNSLKWVIYKISWKIVVKPHFKIGDTISFKVTQETIIKYPRVFELMERDLLSGEYQGMMKNFYSIKIHYFFIDNSIVGGVNNGYKNLEIPKKDCYE